MSRTADPATVKALEDALDAIRRTNRGSGRQSRASRTEANARARSASVHALRLLLDDASFWPSMPSYRRRPVSGAMTFEAVLSARSLLGRELAAVLTRSGYRPPPPAKQLVQDALRAVDSAAAGPGQTNAEVEKARQAVRDLVEALESKRPSRARGWLKKASAVMALTLTVGSFGSGLVEAASDDVYELSKDAVVSLYGAIVGAGRDDPDQDRGADDAVAAQIGAAMREPIVAAAIQRAEAAEEENAALSEENLELRREMQRLRRRVVEVQGRPLRLAPSRPQPGETPD